MSAVKMSLPVPCSTSVHHEVAGGHPIATRSGRLTVTRPASEDSYEAVNRMHGRSSLESRFSRYQAARRRLRPSEWAALVGPEQGRSWVTHPVGSPHLVIATTHLLHTGSSHTGELALLVEDAWQNSGLGRGLTRYALAQASVLGMQTVRVRTQLSNDRMLAICRALGATPSARTNR
ncbi:N-acetyltransferase [Streptomyces sp. NPDC005803]|uniref:GNAT family N-acetyltransferase n=1 Tax=Streptomyces sp. NPDC005803 TaxID=3154297 RepID=UPI0033FD9B83